MFITCNTKINTRFPFPVPLFSHRALALYSIAYIYFLNILRYFMFARVTFAWVRVWMCACASESVLYPGNFNLQALGFHVGLCISKHLFLFPCLVQFRCLEYEQILNNCAVSCSMDIYFNIVSSPWTSPCFTSIYCNFFSLCVVGLNPGRVIPKDVKRWELLLPCLAFNNKG